MQKWDYSIIQYSIFNLLKNLPAVFHSRRNILRFCRQDSKVSLWSTFSCPVLTYPFDDSILKAAGNTSLWFWFALHRRSVMLTIFIFHMLVGHFVYFLWRNVSLGPLFIFTIRSLVLKCINFGTVCFRGWRLTTRPWKALSSCAGCLGLSWLLSLLHSTLLVCWVTLVPVICVLGSCLWDHMRLMPWSSPLISKSSTLSLRRDLVVVVIWGFWCWDLSTGSVYDKHGLQVSVVDPVRCGAGQDSLH